MSPCHSTAAQGTRGSPVRCSMARASFQCGACSQAAAAWPRAHGPAGRYDRAGCEGGCMRLPRLETPWRRAAAEQPESTLAPAAAAALPGRRRSARAARRVRVAVVDSAAPPARAPSCSQLASAAVQLAFLTTVRAPARPSCTSPPCLPPSTLPSGSADRTLTPARLPAAHGLPGWAGGFTARCGVARRAA